MPPKEHILMESHPLVQALNRDQRDALRERLSEETTVMKHALGKWKPSGARVALCGRDIESNEGHVLAYQMEMVDCEDCKAAAGIDSAAADLDHLAEWVKRQQGEAVDAILSRLCTPPEPSVRELSHQAERWQAFDDVLSAIARIRRGKEPHP